MLSELTLTVKKRRSLMYNDPILMFEGTADIHSPYYEELCLAEEADVCAQTNLPALLSPDELALLRELKTEKRRKDWLAGRIAAKRALRRAIAEEKGRTLELNDIVVLNKPSGEPFCRLPGGLTAPHFSISHCSRGGLCGAARGIGRIGVDWEMPVLQPENVFSFYTHPSERGNDRPSAETQMKLWTAKEAVFKFLGVGLSFDLRDIRIPSGNPEIELHGRAQRRWRQLGAPPIKMNHRSHADAIVAVAYG